MRLWAEPETGGEAYIPLAQTKRSRSTAILGDVAKRFGYRLEEYAEGGVRGGSSGGSSGGSNFWGGIGQAVQQVSARTAYFYDDSAAKKRAEDQKRAAEEAARAAEEAARKMKQIQDNMHEFGAMGGDQYVAILNKRMADTEKFTDEWADAMNRRKQIEESVTKYLKALYDKQQADIDNRFSEGRMSMQDWVAEMNKRHEAAVAAEGYWGDQATAVRASLRNEYQRHAALMAQIGVSTDDQHVQFLRGMLAETVQFSAEWENIWNKITAIVEGNVREAQSAYDDAIGNVRSLASDITSEIRSIESEMKQSTDSIASDYANVYEAAHTSFTGQSAAIKEWKNNITRATREAGNAVSAFGSDAYISGEMVGMFFAQHSERVKDFRDTMKSLASTGIDQGLLRSLTEAGPKSIAFAKALQEAIGEGRTDDINAAIDAIKAMSGELGDLAGTFTGDADSIYPTPPIPETKTFNQILAEQTKLFKEQQAVRDAALAWGKAQAAVLIQTNGEYTSQTARLAMLKETLASLYAQFPEMNNQTVDFAAKWRDVAAAAKTAADELARANQAAAAQKAEQQKIVEAEQAKKKKAEEEAAVKAYLESLYQKEQQEKAAVAAYLEGLYQQQLKEQAAVAAYLESLYQAEQRSRGGRAAGGPVSAPGTYLVGENGPETLTIGGGRSGWVTPNGGYGGAGTVVIEKGAVDITISGNADRAMVERVVDEAMDKLLDQITRMLED